MQREGGESNAQAHLKHMCNETKTFALIAAADLSKAGCYETDGCYFRAKRSQKRVCNKERKKRTRAKREKEVFYLLNSIIDTILHFCFY